MSSAELKVALVGCGQIADAHLHEIRKNRRAQLVGVCDRHADLAEQASARFGRPPAFDDLHSMLAKVRPDVVHVTTPPHTHRPVSIAALKSGAHVYVEKPFAIDLAEARDIISTAQACSRLVCVGHDHLFDPAWERCRRLHQAGQLGKVVHVDSVQGYDLDGSFGKAMSAEPEHWIHRLPGGIFHNTISHAVYKITEFLSDDRPDVRATWFGSSSQVGLPTELRVMLKGDGVTANLVFSSLARPVQRLARVYGTRRCVEVDLDSRLIRHYRSNTLPGAFAKIEAPLRHLREAAVSFGRSLRDFVRCDLQFFAGMGRLFDQFYRAAAANGDPPIPYREILRVTAIMDQIFEACHVEASAHVRPLATADGARGCFCEQVPLVEQA
jgi:predicted dehydrogenase